MALSNSLTSETAQPKLTKWLRKHHKGAEVYDVIVPSKSGLSAETIMFTGAWNDGDEKVEQQMVARVKPIGPALFIHYDFALEFAVLEALNARSDVPVPQPFYLETSSEALGSPFYVMSRATGRVAEDDPPFTTGGWVMGLTDADRARMSDEGLKTLAAIHKCDVEELGLSDAMHASDVVSKGNLDHIAYWERFYTWAKGDTDNQLIEYTLNWLKDNAPDDDDRLCLCWGDARIGNMIVADDLSTAAVLDWEMMTLAAPELDLAWWIFLMQHHTTGIGAPRPKGFHSDDETIARYEALTGRKVRNLDYYMVFAGVRMCILVLRAANLMIGAGLLPPDAQMGRVNPSAKLTAQRLGLTASDETSEYYFGNR